MKKKFIIMGVVAVVLIAGGAVVVRNKFRALAPAVLPPPQDIADILPAPGGAIPSEPLPAKNETGLPITLPDGFSVSIFAKNLPGARVMAFDGIGNMWISQPGAGTVSLLEVRDGKASNQSVVFRNLNNPHGLAFDPENPTKLYIAEEDKVSYVTTYSEDTLHKIADLPAGGGHFTRTLLFGPDGRLYVSAGSSCNVCVEQDLRRAAVYSMNKDGSDFRPFAVGLRNAVFMTVNPADQKIWATEMGRDLLGDDIPPDEVNIIEEGKNYGWPYCYGKQNHDASFDAAGTRKNFCASESAGSLIDIPAHSAPLGLAFITGDAWPEEYRHDLLTAYHGSWNRSVPTGYKIVRHKFDAQGNYQGPEDFIAGWLTADNRALGRPVDIKERDGRLYATDDKAGVIYMITYQQQSSGAPVGGSDCRPTGCSSQVCSDQNVITTCEFRPEYACYRDARCERQTDGRCDWTPSEVLRTCLENAQKGAILPR